MASSAGTCTCTEECYPSRSVKKIKWAWTAGSGASVNSIGSSAQTSYAYDGKIVGLITVGAAGGSAPSNDYDITIKNQSSVSVIYGAGGSRAATTQYTKGSSMGWVSGDKLTLGISGTGSSNAGTCYLYIR